MLRKSKSKSVESIFKTFFLQLCKPVANIIFTLIKKALAADGLSGHENNLEFNLAFYMIPGISRDSRDYKPQISLPFPSRSNLQIPVPFP